MKDKEKEKGLHLEIDNLAIPEVRVREDELPDEDDDDEPIDYSGAVPQIHIRHK